MQLIGFRRNVYLEQLEEAATLACVMGQDLQAIRTQLDASLAPRITSDVNRRQMVDILINIWCKSVEAHPTLHATALRLFQQTTAHDDHVTLHYGLTLLTYPFFRQAAQIIGQTLRFGDSVRTATVQEKMPALVGSLGAVYDACRRVTYSLQDWGILVDGPKRYHYVMREPRLSPSTPELTCWLLAAALRAHPAETLPFEDLLRLPELFPFTLTLPVATARQSPLLEVQRSGGGWDMVALARGE